MTATITAITYFTNKIMIRRQVPLARAVTLVEHASAIIPADADLVEVRSPGRTILVPLLIIFSVDKAFIPRLPSPSKAGVYRRDGGLCAYCGRPVAFGEASLDHVTPRAQGGPDTWDNLVNACRPCNQKKADRTPAQARMPLRFRPAAPKVRLRAE